jgi:hypothetical protein
VSCAVALDAAGITTMQVGCLSMQDLAWSQFWHVTPNLLTTRCARVGTVTGIIKLVFY